MNKCRVCHGSPEAVFYHTVLKFKFQLNLRFSYFHFSEASQNAVREDLA